jgi:hypothetical protein
MRRFAPTKAVACSRLDVDAAGRLLCEMHPGGMAGRSAAVSPTHSALQSAMD